MLCPVCKKDGGTPLFTSVAPCKNCENQNERQSWERLPGFLRWESTTITAGTADILGKKFVAGVFSASVDITVPYDATHGAWVNGGSISLKYLSSEDCLGTGKAMQPVFMPGSGWCAYPERYYW